MTYTRFAGYKIVTAKVANVGTVFCIESLAAFLCKESKQLLESLGLPVNSRYITSLDLVTLLISEMKAGNMQADYAVSEQLQNMFYNL